MLCGSLHSTTVWRASSVLAVISTPSQVLAGEICGPLIRERTPRYYGDGDGDGPRASAFTALYYAPMLRRSFLTALVVGTFLTAVNQGNILVHGDFPAALYWKVPLTYVVPFLVATWGALGARAAR